MNDDFKPMESLRKPRRFGGLYVTMSGGARIVPSVDLVLTAGLKIRQRFAVEVNTKEQTIRLTEVRSTERGDADTIELYRNGTGVAWRCVELFRKLKIGNHSYSSDVRAFKSDTGRIVIQFPYEKRVPSA